MPYFRRVSVRIAGATLLTLSLTAAYWLLLLSPQERWLLQYQGSAESFAQLQLASATSGTLASTPDHFVDYVIITDPNVGRVVFASHDSQSLVLAYAPRETSHAFQQDGQYFVRLKESWFSAHAP